MPENSLTDAELVILSLICEQPLHGYQIEQLIAQRNLRAWTALSTSSIYYILQRLEEKGLIEVDPTDDAKSRVPRKTYRITPEGKEGWKAATLRALSHPRITYTNFLVGLHNLWNIPSEEALQAVRTYQAWLEDDLQRQREELERPGVSFFPLDVLFEYGFVLGEAELSFLEDLVARLGEMTRESQHPASTSSEQPTKEEG